MGFFLWYWTKGIKGYFTIWNNFFLIFWNFFSVKHLFSTLFSAWKKDLTPKDWIGLHPILEAQRFAVNIIFRFFGAIVRFVVASFGILVVFGILVAGFLFMIVWGLAPVIFVFSIIGMTLGGKLYGFALLAIVLFLIVTMLTYLEDKKRPYHELPIEKLPKFPWFKRVAQRFGIVPGDLTAGILSDKEKLVDFLKKYDVSIDEFNLILKWEMDLQVAKEKENKFWLVENLRKSVPLGKGWEYGYTVTIDRHALELSNYDPTEYRLVLPIGYDQEIEMSKLVLAKEEQNNFFNGRSGVANSANLSW